MEQGIFFLAGFMMATFIMVKIIRKGEHKLGLLIIEGIQDSVNGHIAMLEEVKGNTGDTPFIDGGLVTAESIAKGVNESVEFYKNRGWEE